MSRYESEIRGRVPRYTNVKVHISEGQKEKLKNALQTSASVSIRLGYEDLNGDDVIALTNSQVNKVVKAYEAKKGVTIKMSKAQLAHNMKVEGGFLAALAGLAARFLPMIAKTVLPALGVGALSGLASTGVQKAIGSGGTQASTMLGDGLYLKKGGCVCQIETDGKGLYLGPVSGSGFESVGDGLYLGKKGGLYDGKGLVLGPNSPFKNIPILGWLL